MTDAFDAINTDIQTFLQAQQTNFYTQEDKQYKLPTSDAIFCALDTPRNRAFFTAIGKAIVSLQKNRENIKVLYAGSGTGILGVFALHLGAEYCEFLEHNPYSLELSKQLVEHCGYTDRVIFRECDATQIEIEPYDLLISETLTSGFVSEEFPQIVNHLRQFGNDHSIIIPEQFEVTLLEKNEAGDIVNTQTFLFTSQDGFEKQIMHLMPETTQITWRTKTCLYDDVSLDSGDCISFMNEMTQEVKNIEHQLFSFTSTDSNEKMMWKHSA